MSPSVSLFFFFLMIRRPPRSTLDRSSAASDVYKRQMDLSYKAELRQQSGMDWKNVALTLSTGNPSQSTIKPELSPFYLSFVQNFRAKYKNEIRETVAAGALSKITDDEKMPKDIMADAPTLAEFISENEKMIQTEYDIKLKYSIPNDPNIHFPIPHLFVSKYPSVKQP